MKRLGYIYLHAPDPENPGQYVTYPIAVEIDEDLRVPENLIR